MKSRLAIAICGAGPGGLACALALIRQGHDVKVFEQFAEAKPIGSGIILQPTGLAVLDWLELGGRIRSLGARIDRLFGKAKDRIVLDVRYSALGGERGYAVHRAALFNVLHEALLEAGVAVAANHKVRSCQGGIIEFDGAPKEGPFDLVVDAMGSRSPLVDVAAGPDYRRSLAYGAIWASLPWPGDPFNGHALEQRYRAASVMCGVLPIGKRYEKDSPQAAFFWSLKHKDYDAWQVGGLESWKRQVRSLWPECEPLLDAIARPDQMILARYDHHTLSLPFGDRLAFVGDSYHSTSPQLGQGANMALLDCFALANALESNKDIVKALEAYAQARRFHVKLFQFMSATFTPFYQSDWASLPLIRDWLVSGISTLPAAQRLLAQMVAGRLGLKRSSLP